MNQINIIELWNSLLVLKIASVCIFHLILFQVWKYMQYTMGAFHWAFCQCFSLTTVISYWNPCIWLAESKFVSEKHWQNAWWNAPQGSISWNLSVTDNCYKLLKSLHLIGWEQICQWKTLTKHLMKCPPGVIFFLLCQQKFLHECMNA